MSILDFRPLGALSRAKAKRPRLVAGLLGTVVAAAWTMGASLTWFAWDVARDLPGRESLRSMGDMAQATTILDAHDTPAFTIYKEQRIEIPLGQMSPHVVRAIIAIEDQRFYEHRGIDAVRVAGAMLINLREGRRAQGGSTITQQLARQSFLTTDKTLRRKLREALLASRIEQTYSKNEILELYLNKVYFGDGLYGIEAASLGFFGKHASELTIDQAALLAGLVKSPSAYAPTVSLDRAVARRNVVLQAMRDAGTISDDEAERARASRPTLVDALRREEPHGAYYKEHVRRALVERFGWQRVYQGGLRVYTTLDLELQKTAEGLVADALTDIEAQRAKRARAKRAAEERARRRKGEPAPEPPPDPPLQGALVAIDVATGAVRAMVGGRSFDESRFNRAVQARRQPGSAFKPFVFAAAIEAGYGPASIIDRLNEPVMTLQGEWVPEDEHSTADFMTLRSALRVSSNRAAVRLLEEVGIQKTVTYAKQLGVGSVPSVPSLALGSGEVTLLSMTAAYGAFAAEGVLREPVLIRRVEDRDGQVLFEAQPAAGRVMSEATAFLVSSMLSDVVSSGTAYRARQVGFTLPAAGKTGTTNDYVDAWFVGYTPRLVAGVWVGFDQPQTILPGGYAGDLAVPIWGRFMKAATQGDRPEWFKPPRGLVGVNVCRVSGMLPNDGCGSVDVITKDGEVQTRSMIYTEYFPRERQPLDVCPLHQGQSFMDRVAGLFGKDGTPPVPADAALLPPAQPAQTSGTAAPPAAAPQPKPAEAEPAKPVRKKRGFWSRVFGIGRDRNEPDQKQEDDRRPREAPPR